MRARSVRWLSQYLCNGRQSKHRPGRAGRNAVEGWGLGNGGGGGASAGNGNGRLSTGEKTRNHIKSDRVLLVFRSGPVDECVGCPVSCFGLLRSSLEGPFWAFVVGRKQRRASLDLGGNLYTVVEFATAAPPLIYLSFSSAGYPDPRRELKPCRGVSTHLYAAMAAPHALESPSMPSRFTYPSHPSQPR